MMHVSTREGEHIDIGDFLFHFLQTRTVGKSNILFRKLVPSCQKCMSNEIYDFF